MDYGMVGMVNIDVYDLRTYQDLAFLVDREDFLIKIGNLRVKQLLDTKIDEKEISKLKDYYKYPDGLCKAIRSAVFDNKITDLDIFGYENSLTKVGILKDYSHPILSLKLNKQIKLHRLWYAVQHQTQKINKIGYRKISRLNSKDLKNRTPITTIQTAINTYKKNLQIKI